MRRRPWFSARRHPRSRGAGFTLLESMLALIIIAVGVLAFVDAQAAFTMSNNWSSRAATGMLLANEVREMSQRFPRHDRVTGLALVGTGSGAVLEGWGRENGETDIDDLDDLDDLDGVTFGPGGTFPGPVDAFGNIVPQTDLHGVVLTDNGEPVPLVGWRQRIIVEKVDPYNFSLTRADAYQQTATAQVPAIPVDEFPLRVTVIVEHQESNSTQWDEVTRTTWIAPP
jgi:prepilin-type N-terminal cleavage/methylation domain-containing protein